MQSFRTFLTEGTKLTKTEEQFLSKFVKNPKTEVKVVHYRGTGQIRGGGSASGKKDYDLALKLAQKKVLTIVKKEKTSPYHSEVIVKLTNPDMPIGLKLTKKQESVLWSIKRANELVKKGREWEQLSYKMFTQNDQEKIFDQLKDMGLIDFKFYELPKITKSGASIVGT